MVTAPSSSHTGMVLILRWLRSLLFYSKKHMQLAYTAVDAELACDKCQIRSYMLSGAPDHRGCNFLPLCRGYQALAGVVCGGTAAKRLCQSTLDTLHEDRRCRVTYVTSGCSLTQLRCMLTDQTLTELPSAGAERRAGRSLLSCVQPVNRLNRVSI